MKISTKFNICFFVLVFLPVMATMIFTLWYYDNKLEEMIREKSMIELNSATLLLQQNIKKIKEFAGMFSTTLRL